jgi:rare lipoprotein A
VRRPATRAALFVPLLVLAACGGAERTPRYVVGAPYEIGGVMRYPFESFELDETGIATSYSRGGTTASGERFDSTALTAAHRTLQLPSVARITNLENGRQVMVRVNDRGPTDPARLIAVSRRAAQLLGAANAGAFRVRVQVMDAESRALAAEMQGRAPPDPRAPVLVVDAAPRAGVQAEALAPPSGAASGRQRSAAPGPAVLATGPATGPVTVPRRMPETVTHVSPRPGTLAVDCGGFSTQEAAAVMLARLAPYGARMQADYHAPRDRAVVVRIGPQPSLAQAEATLRRVLPAGCIDARIVVE